MTDLLAGRYALRTRISRGGMGAVWLARDVRLDRDVAVKLLHPWIAEDADLRGRFAREARVLAPLEHEHVVRLYDYGEDGETPYLVMELVQGCSLAELARGRRLSWEAAREICRPIAAALAYAHERGIVHRDLTPANVLIEAPGGRVVVTDFGLARLARSSTSLTTRGMLLGTPEYWSPEQARGADSETATDLYALGCILFALLAGRPPFEGDDRLAVGLRRAHEDAPSLAAVVPGAPAPAATLVDRLLARDPAARPSAADALEALGGPAAAEGPPAPVDVRPAGAPDVRTLALPAAERTLTLPVPRAHRVRSRGRGRRAVVAAALAALAGALAFVGATIANADAVVQVPRVTGLTVATARAAVAEAAHADRAAEAPLEVSGRAYSETVSAGRVLAQAPAAGSRVARNDLVVRVRVSRGSAWAEVPELAGLTRAEAVQALRALGFRAGVRLEESWDVPEGIVVEGDVGAGAEARRPGPIGVAVSSGRPKAAVADVRGLSVDDARDALESSFDVHVQESGSDTAEPGAVLRQDPAPGTAEVGSTVTLVVARPFQWTEVYDESGSGDFDGEDFRIEVPQGRWRIVYSLSPRYLIFGSGRATFTWEGTGAGAVALDDAGTSDAVEPLSGAGAYRIHVRPQGSVSWSVRVEALS